MAHEDSGWTPDGATELFNGFEVWDHGVWPGDVNQNDTTTDDDE